MADQSFQKLRQIEKPDHLVSISDLVEHTDLLILWVHLGDLDLESDLGLVDNIAGSCFDVL